MQDLSESSDLRVEVDADAIASFGDEPTGEPSYARAPQMFRGRGATLSPPSRYDRQTAESFDDGWSSAGPDFGDLPPLPTTLLRDASRSVISWNTSPDLGFDRSVNPYRGCEHGCVYCFARPTHAYLGYSPGAGFRDQAAVQARCG